MKKRIFVIAALTAMLLTGCNKAGMLPSGGKKVDFTTEEGAAVLVEKMKLFAESYSGEKITAAGVSAELGSTNITAKGQVAFDDDEGMKDVEASIKDLKGKFAMNVKQQDDKSVIANAKLSGLGATIKAKGNFVLDDDLQLEIDDKLTVKDMTASAYFQNRTLYVDYSSKNNTKAIENVNKVVNDVMGRLAKQQGFAYLVDLNALIDNEVGVPSRKIAIIDNDMFDDFFPLSFKVGDEEIAELLGMLNAYKDFVEFQTYKDGRFGFQIIITKDKLINLMTADAEGEEKKAITDSINEIVKKLDLKAAVLFDKAGLLSSVGFSANVEAHLTTKNIKQIGGLIKFDKKQPLRLEEDSSEEEHEEEKPETMNLTLTFKTSGSASLTWNDKVKVKLPSDKDLAGYTVINEKKPDPEEIGE